ncbi:MAG: hypothetical protein NT166_16780 [Candidatus Aminicenantes bacterium]|nr:hypothetical protein [Candidatus Aminicenantes bacterium]
MIIQNDLFFNCCDELARALLEYARAGVEFIRAKGKLLVCPFNFHKGSKYIIETKVNRQSNITRMLSQGIAQVTGKYLASEFYREGYLVIFDTKTRVGETCEPRYYPVGDKKVTTLIIGIGRDD